MAKLSKAICKKIGKNLKKIRNERYLHTGEVARLAGISPGGLSVLERGIHTPSHYMIAALAPIYGISIQELMLGHTPSTRGNQGHKRKVKKPLLNSGKKRNISAVVIRARAINS